MIITMGYESTVNSGTGSELVPVATTEVAGKVKASPEVQVLQDGTMVLGNIKQEKVVGLAEALANRPTVSEVNEIVNQKVGSISDLEIKVQNLEQLLTWKIYS